MGERYEIRLAGSGGQGLILAGLILAEAVVLHDGKNACQTQSYGPEARGGASKSEVVIDDDEIDFPKVIAADALLTLSQEACDKYYHDLERDGLLIVDSVHVRRVPTSRAYRLPITQIAEDVTGRRITANIVGLGVLAGIAELCGRRFVSRDALRAAVAARAPEGTRTINLQALDAGFEAAEHAVNEG